MKQIPLLQGKALLVELPEGATNPRIEKGYLWYDDDNFIGVIARVHLSQKYNWQIIGMLSEVREEQAIPLVDKERFIVDGPDLGFRNYKGNKYDWFGTAIESLDSAIEAEGFMFSGDECPNAFCENGKIDVGYGEFASCGICDESRVLCRERCLLLGREDV